MNSIAIGIYVNVHDKHQCWFGSPEFMIQIFLNILYT